MSAMVSARASASAPARVDMLSDELALCAAARADTGVPARMDLVRVGVPLVVAFTAGVADDVGVEALGVLADDAAWVVSVEDVRPDAEELGFFVTADMMRLWAFVYLKLHILSSNGMRKRRAAAAVGRCCVDGDSWNVEISRVFQNNVNVVIVVVAAALS